MPDPIPVWPPRNPGTVQWMDRRGRVTEYRGPVVDLGVAVPRPHRADAPGWGIRRAVYDLAFGYVSGFPLPDVLRFSLRSLWPTPIRTVNPVTEWFEEAQATLARHHTEFTTQSRRDR